MRFLFRPPPPTRRACSALPWDQPLEEWDPALLLEVPQRGISRHVVRFVASSGHVFALKEINERLARHEYALLGEFEEEGLPTVSVLGICVDRPHDQEAILVTRYLEYSMSYRWLFSSRRGEHSAEQLLDTLVELLVRLHLAGVFWGDCSLSNTLFRPDAGALTAHLVDAETVERHPTLSPGQRAYDVDLARERVGAELMDLRFGGLLPEDIDPIDVAESLPPRYEALWEEVTHEEVFGVEEQQYRMAERLQRLNDLGFDVEEVELITSAGGRPAEGGDPRGRARSAPPGAVPADRAGGAGGAGPPAAQRHPGLPGLPGAEVRRIGVGVLRGPPVAQRDLPARRRRDPAGPGRPAGAGGGLPRGARAPLVPLRAGTTRRRDGGGGGVLRRQRAARRRPRRSPRRR